MEALYYRNGMGMGMDTVFFFVIRIKIKMLTYLMIFAVIFLVELVCKI